MNAERVVVLFFEGAGSDVLRALMDAGRLPNLARLAGEGAFTALGSDLPCDRIGSWSSLITGVGPEEHGVRAETLRSFDESGVPVAVPGNVAQGEVLTSDSVEGHPFAFADAKTLGLWTAIAFFFFFLLAFGRLMRLSRRAAVGLALVLAGVGYWSGFTLRKYVPDSFAVAGNPLKAAPFWVQAAREGIAAIALGPRQAWGQAEDSNLRIVAASEPAHELVRGAGWLVYSSDPQARAPAHLPLARRAGRYEGVVEGPRDLPHGTAARFGADAEARPALPLVVEVQDAFALVSLGNQSQRLVLGGWSDWYRLSFTINPLLKVNALARVKLLALGEQVELLLSPLELDPGEAPFWRQVGSPSSFPRELAEEIGPFGGTGWLAPNGDPGASEVGMAGGSPDLVSFVEHSEASFRTRERMVTACLERDDWTLLVGCFDLLERVQLALAHLTDSRHPAYDGEAAERNVQVFGKSIPLRGIVEEAYVQLDALAGKVLDQYLGPEDALIVLSSGGIESIHRQFFANSWLAKHGHLHWREDAGLAGAASSELPMERIDWSRTRAYALGPGRIYVNLRGREPLGIVEMQSAGELLEQLRSEFLATVDPGTGAHVGGGAYLRGAAIDEMESDEADLVLGFEQGYAAAPLRADGPRPGEQIVEDRMEIPSGGCDSLDVDVARGAFFCNIPLTQLGLDPKEGRLDRRNIAPAILDLLHRGRTVQVGGTDANAHPTSDR